MQKYLAALSNESAPGVIAGQNTGHGNEIAQPAGLVGYAALLDSLQQQSGETPGIVGVDYEHNQAFTPAQLAEANRLLIAHWNRGGLVTINWSPQNPWWNDESDLVNNPGVWTNTRTTGGNMSGIALRDLLDPAKPIHAVWRRKLDRIATALQELQQAGVVVLWRPMQEMNGTWFWWGIYTSRDDAGPYIALWRDMFRYFTVDKGLHNLLWLYSPSRGPLNAVEESFMRPPRWTYYPGDAYVDVIAGTNYDDALSIPDYEVYRSFGKPVGMGEFGPTLEGNLSVTASFDTLHYSRRLPRDYPGVAFWVTWHNWSIDGVRTEHQAMVSNRNAAPLMQSAATLTASRLKWKDYR